MSRNWRWAAAPLCAGLVLALLSANARGETFVFQDSQRGQRQGSVLVEFPELLFVAIDGEGPTFIRRAELLAVIDEAGKRHESAPLGTFAAIGKRAPAAAVTDITGTVWLSGEAKTKDAFKTSDTDQAKTKEGGAEEPAPGKTQEADSAGFDDKIRPGETLLRAQEGGAEFVSAGGGLRTGQNGVVHGLFPSGAQFWVGVESEVSFGGPSEQIGLGSGELSIESRLTPIQVQSARPLDLRLAELSYVVIQRAGRVIKLDQQRGRTRIAWPEFSFALHGGQSVALSDLGKGRWTVQADSANDEVIHLMVKGKKETLGPGKERELGTEVISPTSLWRHLASTGEIMLRRGLQGSFRPVPAVERSLLSLGPGDALKTPTGAEAALVRQDGARLTLRASTWLEVGGEELELERGELLAEVLGAPVVVKTPGGRASLGQSVVVFKRLGEGDLSPVQVMTVAGRVLLPLGYARMSLEARSTAILSLTTTPVDPPKELEALKARTDGPSGALSSGALPPEEGERRVVAREGLELDSGLETNPDDGTAEDGTAEDGTTEDGTAEDGSEGEGEDPASGGQPSESESPQPGELPTEAPREKTPRAVAPLPASTRGVATLPSVRVELLHGAAQIESGPVEELGDPSYRVFLNQGDVIEVRPPSTLKPFGALALPLERELRMRGADLEVELVLDEPPLLRYEGLKDVMLKEGLVVGLNRVRNLPALEFRSGERLLLDELPHSILVENPTVIIEGQEAVVEFTDGIEATLKAAGQHGAQAFGTREDDHLEAHKNAKGALGINAENVQMTWEDGRQLRIQPKAPPVDARVSDAKGTMFLSMPGAPSLGLRPETPLTVLATNEGEFVILDGERIAPDGLERQGLSYGLQGDSLSIESERILDLLDVPLPDSPSGP